VKAGFVASGLTAEFQELNWKSLLESGDERIRFEAMKYLTDRVFGKAPQAVALKHSRGSDIDLAERVREAR
jgi:hypothetical protein